MDREKYDEATELFKTIENAQEDIDQIGTLFTNMNNYKQKEGTPVSGYIQILSGIAPTINITEEILLEKILLEIKAHHINDKNAAQKELDEL